MNTHDIVKLSRPVINQLLEERGLPVCDEYEGQERRRMVRWPFPGTVEIWPADGDGRTKWFATCSNLNERGLGMVCDEPFDVDTPLEIAFHLPEASVFGQAVVCHCTEIPQGFMVGVKFVFEK